MKLIDTSGRLHHVLCALTLFVHHGLRDFLITGIPSLSGSVSEEGPLNVTTATPLTIQNVALHIQMQMAEDETLQKGWTDNETGGVLSSVHWGIFIPLVVSPFVIPRVPTKYLLGSSLLGSGFVSLFSELASQNGYIGLLILRLIQGGFQGWCYPLVFYMLEDLQSLSFVFPYFFIFYAPWLGSAFGVVLGWAENPFVGSYVMGSMSIILGGIFLISSTKTKPLEKPERTWRECLSSPALWSCVLVCMASTWALHSILVGLSFTLYFKYNKNNLMWMVVVVIFVGGLITRLSAIIAMHLLRNNFLSPRNRRRMIIITGTLVVIACLILNAECGLKSEYALFGVSIIGVGLGVGLLLVGVRLNLHDLGPLFPTPFLLLGSIGGTLGAASASLLFPILAQTDNIGNQVDKDDYGPWRKAWMVPVGPIAVACCLHMFLVSVRPLAHQTLLKRTTAPVLKLNGAFENSEEMDAKSFKSLKSALSFKTAVSKRSRTVSFQTVADNVEIDLHSLPESKSDDCVSIVQVEDADNAEMKSIKSGVTSFKSAANSRSNSVDATPQYGVALNVKELDRTSAWLTTHHDKTSKLETQNSVEKNTAERNILIALQW